MQHLYVFKNDQQARGFSLIEVVLAIGIFLVTVLALVGLLGPTLKSVNQVEKTDEMSSIVNTVNAFLQSAPEIKGDGTTSKFDLIYNAVYGDDYATLFVFREYLDDLAEDDRLVVGFKTGETLDGGGSIGVEAQIANERFEDASGTIYRVVLTPSSVLPTSYRTSTLRDRNTNTFKLKGGLDAYKEGYFAMEVRIYAEAPPGAGGAVFDQDKELVELTKLDPIFTYNTAVVR